MDKLIRRSELSKEDLKRVEDPFFAVSKVKHALLYDGYLWGKRNFWKLEVSVLDNATPKRTLKRPWRKSRMAVGCF